jgi:hypothetical protein
MDNGQFKPSGTHAVRRDSFLTICIRWLIRSYILTLGSFGGFSGCEKYLGL